MTNTEVVQTERVRLCIEVLSTIHSAGVPWSRRIPQASPLVLVLDPLLEGFPVEAVPYAGLRRARQCVGSRFALGNLLSVEELHLQLHAREMV